MHVVTLTKPLKDNRWDLPEGHYLAEDLSAFEIGIAADRGTSKISPYFPVVSSSRSNVLLVSNGGLGDMLMLTPAIKRFRELYPFSKLTLSTRKKVWCVFEGLDFAPTLIDYPVPLENVSQYDQVLTTEGIQEDESERAKTVPAIDLKAYVLGVEPLTGGWRKTWYNCTEEEKKWAIEKYPRMKGGCTASRKRICIQVESSSPTRNYHFTLMGKLFSLLYDDGWEILLLGSPGSRSEDSIPPNKRDLIKNLTLDNLTFRQSVAVMTTCDVFFGVDSSGLHVCGALNIPAVGIFGSTHWKTRASDYPSVTAIQSNMGCPISPCYHHPRGASIFPAGQLCATKGYCGPIQAIDPERIFASIKKKL